MNICNITINCQVDKALLLVLNKSAQHSAVHVSVSKWFFHTCAISILSLLKSLQNGNNINFHVLMANQGMYSDGKYWEYRRNQGHPMTVFCEISVRRSKSCLEFSVGWGRLRLLRWPFHSCTIFEAYRIYEFPRR